MNSEKIIIKGAREHNLKNIDLEIPRNKLVVITGLSGSGKSSLAFDTIYAEGQRRYVESLSAYARQFLEQMEKPDVDSITGLSPAIAIQQRAPSRNPRSTVGTTTEIYDYLRLLFAKIGIPHCYKCGREVKPQSAQQMVDEILKLPTGTKILVLSPLIRGRIGTYKELFNRLKTSGFVRVRINNKVCELNNLPNLSRYKKQNIELVVDRLEISSEIKTRLTDSVETALKEGQGLVMVNFSDGKEILYSEHLSCVHCGISIGEIEPRNFSFNSPYGACNECDGLGTKLEVDEDLVVPNKDLSVYEGAILPWSKPITTRKHRWSGAWSNYYLELLEGVARRNNFSLDEPFKKLSRDNQKYLLYGDYEFEGVINNLDRRYKETESEYVREEIYNKYVRTRVCEKCKGRRLKDEALAVTIYGRNISEITALSIKDTHHFFSNLNLTEKEKTISKQIMKELLSRFTFLINVGLDYLTLDRETQTLAGGEAQRIHLATQIGSGLVGVLYILDEPTIGLHQRDNSRLLDTLIKLRDLGNTLLVVEHDEATIKTADFIIDLGPGAGEFGGEIIVSGELKNILKEKNSLTGKYLNGELKIPTPKERRKPKGKFLKIISAEQFNLKNINVNFPLGLFTVITGVSGSGKSTLVYEVLYKALAKELYRSKEIPGKHKRIDGLEFIDKVIIVDQSPIGRTPRSNPATYTGAFTPIRDIFSQLPQSKVRGYKPGRFSFNVKGGRCENCSGDGTIKIEMQFLPDVYVKCEVCGGKRFNDETLQVRYKGKNVSDVLNMSVNSALKFFENIPHVYKIIKTLDDVGLGYIKLGQPATTLSGGEAQRVKLAEELSKRATGRTIYILDEPTTGLHFADVEKLLSVLHRLVDAGNTVIVIEHNLDVIKTSDWIIDLGPEGGDLGGEVVYQGVIEGIIKVGKSHTSRYLKEKIDNEFA